MPAKVQEFDSDWSSVKQVLRESLHICSNLAFWSVYMVKACIYALIHIHRPELCRSFLRIEH
ncbi:hypothetical protein D3C76_288460 [compost metagenome]